MCDYVHIPQMVRGGGAFTKKYNYLFMVWANLRRDDTYIRGLGHE